jgi:phosphoglycerate kinase
LPEDLICAASSEGNEAKTFTIQQGIPANFEAFDEGDLTKRKYRDIISRCKTIIWNGPLSFFENPKFRNASYGVLESMIEATANGAITIGGGGDTGALIRTYPGAEEKLTHVSTGGGASLELLEGRKLPGIEFLTNLDGLPKISI